MRVDNRGPALQAVTSTMAGFTPVVGGRIRKLMTEISEETKTWTKSRTLSCIHTNKQRKKQIREPGVRERERQNGGNEGENELTD